MIDEVFDFEILMANKANIMKGVIFYYKTYIKAFSVPVELAQGLFAFEETSDSATLRQKSLNMIPPRMSIRWRRNIQMNLRCSLVLIHRSGSLI